MRFGLLAAGLLLVAASPLCAAEPAPWFPAFRLAAMAAAEPAGPVAATEPAPESRVLHFLYLPEGDPLDAGLGALTPSVVLDRIRVIGALGEELLAAVDASGYRRIHVLGLAGRRIPDEHRALMERIVGPRPERRLSRSALGVWMEKGDEGLIVLHLDRIARSRRLGGLASPASVLAHELAHVAQAAAGSLDRRQDVGTFYDHWDEAEADLVLTLVLRRELRAAGQEGRLNVEARAGMEAAATGATPEALRAVYELRDRDPLLGLFRSRRDDPARYDPARDPFAPLRGEEVEGR